MPMVAAQTETTQRIARLTPLGDALTLIDSIAPVTPRQLALAGAAGRVLAADLRADAARPAAPLALRDGWAVRADLLADAGAYAPALLPAVPRRVQVGDAMPADADTVAEADAVVIQAGRAEAVAPVAPGEGVLPARADAESGSVLRRAGERLRHTDLAVLAGLGVAAVAVREPRVRVVCAGRPGEVMRACGAFVAAAVDSCGGVAILEPPAAAEAEAFEAALHHEAADAVIAIGGTGEGHGDGNVRALAALGTLRFHGLGVSPGETTAFGVVGSRPVLLVPGRLDATLSMWLVLGRALLARLADAREQATPVPLALTRKVASPIGLATVVPVRRRGDGVEPLASGYLPLGALAQADGWILVPADSEGYPAGTRVHVRSMP
jgi:molybdopterin biosynthesis enzyme